MELPDIRRQITPTPTPTRVVASWLAQKRQCSRAVPTRRLYRRRAHQDAFRRDVSVSHDDGWRLKLHGVSRALSQSQRFANVHAQLTRTQSRRWPIGGHMSRAENRVSHQRRDSQASIGLLWRLPYTYDSARWLRTREQTLPRAPTGRARTHAAVPDVGCACSHVRFGCRGPCVLPYGAATAARRRANPK